MKLLADKTGEQFLHILSQNDDSVVVQFINNEGLSKGLPFRDSLKGLALAGWTKRTTSSAIGLYRFRMGYLEDAHVSFALHRLYPLGRKVRLPSGEVARIASYANTHSDGYYMYIAKDSDSSLQRYKITPEWELLPSEELLALPYYPMPRTAQELKNIQEFDEWSRGF
ncbi:hypothetical protein ACRZ5S_20650 [Vibrio scophthalmi]|uniref:hypothetical protein n=1 Tax=Vibrio scophthalmi TaxID=45658 RepID=UPI003EBF205F